MIITNNCSHLATVFLVIAFSEAVGTRSSVTMCGPRGAITMAGSPSGVPLAVAWAKEYQQGCRNTTITVTSSNSSNGAKRVCGLSSAGTAGSPVDVAIRSRPFQSTEATTTDGYSFKCAQGNKTRTAIQVKVALGAFVLVVAPNGTAAYCLKHLYNNGLTLDQLRILFSNYTPAQIFNISTPSPSYPPAPYTLAPTFAPTKRTSAPSEQPKTSGKGTHAPAHPTHRPTLPRPAVVTTYWTFPHYHTRGGMSSAEAFCSRLPALVAGSPQTSESSQDFATRVLLEYGRGEGFASRYYGSARAETIVSYLQTNTNAIAVVSLPDYVAFQNKLKLVTVQDHFGIYRVPNSTTLAAGFYPLSYDIFMEVRSDDAATLARLRPFFTFAYSLRGSAAVSCAGLVPLSNATRVQMLSQLMATFGGAATRSPKVAPIKNRTRRKFVKGEKTHSQTGSKNVVLSAIGVVVQP